jgi:hypothetical protein
MIKDEALQMCLEYIETDAHERRHVRWAIKEALSADIEPVNYEKLAALGWQSIECPFCESAGAQAFPHRTFVGLTDEVITKVIDSMPKKMRGFMDGWDLYDFTRAIEAKLKENNT